MIRWIQQKRRKWNNRGRRPILTGGCRQVFSEWRKKPNQKSCPFSECPINSMSGYKLWIVGHKSCHFVFLTIGVILNETCIEEKTIFRLIVLAYSHTCGSFRKCVLFTEHSVNKNNNFYHKAEEKDGVNVRSNCLIWQNWVLDGDKLQKWILKIWTLISKDNEQ